MCDRGEVSFCLQYKNKQVRVGGRCVYKCVYLSIVYRYIQFIYLRLCL